MPHRWEQGLNRVREIDPEEGDIFLYELKQFFPAFAEHYVGFAFGGIHSREVLEPQVKELVIIATLIGRGHEPQLSLHIVGALNAGCTKEQILEVILQSVVNVGFPAALGTLRTAEGVFRDFKPANGRSRKPNSPRSVKGTKSRV